VNVRIVNGTGTTDGTVNGLGNLIVGYNESRGATDDRSGSHNIVGGIRNNYSSYGGLVVGYMNTISGACATVSGGHENTADGETASVSGGVQNIASGLLASVSGGAANTASGDNSSVSGGDHNLAYSHYSSILGGEYNVAGITSGGHDESQKATVSGGNANTANGPVAHISGGRDNIATGWYSVVSGGASRSVLNTDDWRAGGYFQEN